MRKTSVTPEELFNVIRDVINERGLVSISGIATEAMKRLDIKFGYEDVKEAVTVILQSGTRQ